MHVSTSKKTRCVCLYTYQSAELSSNRLAQVAQKSVPPPCGRFKIADRGEKRLLCSENGKIWHPKRKNATRRPHAPLLLVPQTAENGRKWQLQGRKRLFVPHFCIRLGPLHSLSGRCFAQMAPFFRLCCLFFLFFLLFGMLFINFRLLRHLLSLERSNFWGKRFLSFLLNLPLSNAFFIAVFQWSGALRLLTPWNKNNTCFLALCAVISDKKRKSNKSKMKRCEKGAKRGKKGRKTPSLPAIPSFFRPNKRKNDKKAKKRAKTSGTAPPSFPFGVLQLHSAAIIPCALRFLAASGAVGAN